MGQCSQCGSSIPDGQSICSMCMGDIDHGSDGYYRQWAEQEMERERDNEQAQAEYEADQAQYEESQREQDAEAEFEREQQAMAEAEYEAAGRAAEEEAQHYEEEGY